MFKLAKRICFLAVSIYMSAQVVRAEQQVEKRILESRKVVQDFADRLKGELMAVMKAGGPEEAISVCNTAAPTIAKDLSERKGWSIGRTALRVRNAANAPDMWERSVLEKFLEEAEKGSDLKKLDYHELTTHDGKRVFRFLKAIPTGKVCLTCHGRNVEAGLYRKIKDYYPEDEATGFKLGELRGAFTIIQPME